MHVGEKPNIFASAPAAGSCFLGSCFPGGVGAFFSSPAFALGGGVAVRRAAEVVAAAAFALGVVDPASISC